MAFNLDNYEDVQSRVKRFQEAYPMGRINTTVIEFNSKDGFVLVQAQCFRDDITELPAGVDYAYGNVAFYPTHMKRFFVEDTITSAIGRCISLVLPTELKSTKQDMSRVGSTSSAPVADAWTVYKSEDAQMPTLGTSGAELAASLGAELISEAPLCVHGHMVNRQSKPDAPKEWSGYFCTQKTKAQQCDPIWQVRSASTGEWRLP